MNSACTVVCPSIAYASFVDAVKASAIVKVEIDGPATKWKHLQIKTGETTLEFNSLVRVKPGDRFSKTILGMHNFFNGIKTAAKHNKTYVLDRVANSQMLIGVVATPEFSEVDGHFECIWSGCERLDALVFTGDSMLDSTGRKILDLQGKFDRKIRSED